jgi:hypothetical protein
LALPEGSEEQNEVVWPFREGFEEQKRFDLVAKSRGAEMPLLPPY